MIISKTAKYLLPVFALLLTTNSHAADLDKAKIIKDAGLQLPETILHDTKKDVYLISNVNAHPTAKDDNGFISIMNPDGTIKELKWIDGASNKVTLHAPKGMALENDKLYVADVDTVRIFDANTGAPLQEIEIKGTTFLNDIVVRKDGTMFVSESAVVFEKGKFSGTGKDAIYRVSADGKVETWKSGADLGQPNGMEITNDNKVSVVTRGSNRLYVLDDDGKEISSFNAPGKVLDGLVQLPSDDYLVTSWETTSIYRIKAGKATTEMKLPTPVANLAYDRKRKVLLVPLLLKHQIALVENLE